MEVLGVRADVGPQGAAGHGGPRWKLGDRGGGHHLILVQDQDVQPGRPVVHERGKIVTMHGTRHMARDPGPDLVIVGKRLAPADHAELHEEHEGAHEEGNGDDAANEDDELRPQLHAWMASALKR